MIFRGEFESVYFLVFRVPEVADHGGSLLLFFNDINKLLFLWFDLQLFRSDFEGDIRF